MAHIKLPELEEMTPEIQNRAREILEKSGKLGDIFKLMALHEPVYFATDAMVQGYLLNETLLPYSTKESIALLVSIENGCKMCVDVHKSIAKMLGLSEERINQILEGIDAIDTDNREKSLLRFCVKASKKDNYKILKDEIDNLKLLGYSDKEIVEAVAITGYFNYINTLSNVFGLS